MAICVSWTTVIVSTVVLLVFCVETALTAGDWHYEAVENWKATHEKCGGSKQSPINIATIDAIYEPSLDSFDLSKYVARAPHNTTIQNNGHTAQISYEYTEDGAARIEISKGGLPGVYVFSQLHFHWKSEHTLNRQHFPLEVHFVHYLKEHGSLQNAISHQNGIAVLGFFFEESQYDADQYLDILRLLDRIVQKGEPITVPAFSLATLLPIGMKTFYRYNGSLTTPTCDESVIWTVFADTIKMSKQQLDNFSILKDGAGHTMAYNFREVKPLNERKVYVNRPVGGVALGSRLTAGSILLLIGLAAKGLLV